MPSHSMADSLQEKIQHYQDKQFTGLLKVSAYLQTQINSAQPNYHQSNHPEQPNHQEGLAPHEWVICLLLGRIVWVTASSHSLRRWKRALCVHSPDLFHQINQHPGGIPYQHWHYTALARLVKLKQYPQDQFSQVVASTAIENLFNILQIATQGQQPTDRRFQHVLTYEDSEHDFASLPVLMIEQADAWEKAHQAWTAWERAALTEISPDWAPIIIHIEALRTNTSPQTFQTLIALLTGKNTLRGLAIQFRQPIVPFTKSILPYVSGQLLGFTDIPDLIENANHGFPPTLFAFAQEPASASAPKNRSEAKSAAMTVAATERATPALPQPAVPIIYIEDSPTDSRLMSSILVGLGYQYTNIPDPVQALPLLLEIRPKLIFLDLVMPIANGYEVCSKIRRMSAFKNTPIIIVTSNNGIADRVRARFAGASGFLGKPIQPSKVAKVLTHYLPAPAPSPISKTMSQQTKQVLYSRP